MYKQNQHVVRALTIAGSDSGGGAGIQADLKTMHQFQVYGSSVITAVTAQNTLGVQAIAELEPSFVRQQMHSVLQDIGADAIKTGMLSSAPIISEVANFLSQVESSLLVVDPVMVAKGGAPLLKMDAVDALVTNLLPLAMIVTPNIPEAEVLCGYAVATLDDCRRAAVDIAAMGPQIVVIKGGHMMNAIDGFAIDLIYRKDAGFVTLATARVETKKSHGTGCTFSAAITAMLARGAQPLQAIAIAKAFVYEAILGASNFDVGAGHGPTDHSAKIHFELAVGERDAYLYEDNQWIPWEEQI